MKAKIVSLGVLLLLLAAATLWLMRSPPARQAAEQPAAAETETMQASGKIFGLAIGDPIEAARQRLDPLREPIEYTPDAKEKTGRRIYWKLRGTEFEWIMVWGNPQGRISRIRGYYRADQTQPFSAIGDLATADSVTPHAAKWTLRRSGTPYFRFVAEGIGQQARSVYMFSLELPGEQQESRTTPPDEQD